MRVCLRESQCACACVCLLVNYCILYAIQLIKKELTFLTFLGGGDRKDWGHRDVYIYFSLTHFLDREKRTGIKQCE